MRLIILTMVIAMTTIVNPALADSVVLKCSGYMVVELDYTEEKVRFDTTETELAKEEYLVPNVWGETEIVWSWIRTSPSLSYINIYHLDRVSGDLRYHSQMLKPNSDDTRMSNLKKFTCKPINSRTF